MERKDEILVFTNFKSLVLISTMIALLVILFMIKLYSRNNTFKDSNCNSNEDSEAKLRNQIRIKISKRTFEFEFEYGLQFGNEA